MKTDTTIFWFRQDLRLSDNPGLFEATQNGNIIPVYILDDSYANDFKMGAASKWWLHSSLHALNNSLDGKLNVYKGDSFEVLLKIIKENKATAVYWNRCYEPWRIKNDTYIKSGLKEKSIKCKSFNASLLWEPWETCKGDNAPYKVFTPFYKNARTQNIRKPLPKPQTMYRSLISPHTIDDLGLMPNVAWYKTMESWEIGEIAAQKKLSHFLEYGLNDYKEGRNHPAKKNVSRLSPHLHFGEISPNQIWHEATCKKEMEANLAVFLSELGWREFSYSLLYHFPNLPTINFQNKFDHFPWELNQDFLKAWQQGKTGYPIVDAGMRELWQTGYMHNRVRMIVGSFLVKNLTLHWHHGRDWFWNCLVDADLASNSASWQWIAGCGADAAPYFRIFNPVLQGEKFDPIGEYTLSFVPELAQLPLKYLFKPWEAPLHILKNANVILGQTYPKPIVNIDTSRKHALACYQSIRK
jgi:deoxyribodipyrimidine photo-lyase